MPIEIAKGNHQVDIIESDCFWEFRFRGDYQKYHMGTPVCTKTLFTAGVKDAKVAVEAPFLVSGTAALAGITKTFQVATGKNLDPNRTSVANREMVQIAQLGQQIGNPEKTATFMNMLKNKMAQVHPQTDQQYKDLINQFASQMRITLTSDQVNTLISLLK